MYSKKEKLFLLILFVLAIGSLFFYLKYRTLAFPEHNIKFAITREQAAEKATQFASKLGLKPQQYKNSTIFDMDYKSKTYLEREVGVAETAQLAERHLGLWGFSTRFFQPLKKEEFSIWYRPNGQLDGFTHVIEEHASGATLSKEQAQKNAEKFLMNTISVNMANWKLISVESTKKPNRTDHTIIWEEKNFKAKDATNRMYATILGDQIGGYGTYLKIPDAWTRNYEKERSQNDLAQNVASTTGYPFFILSMIVVFILKFRNNNLNLKFAAVVGLIGVIISLLMSLNSLPLSFYYYNTTSSWEAFIGNLVFSSITNSLFKGLTIFVIIATGEALYRAYYPNKLSLPAQVRQALTTKYVNKALLIGFFLAIISLAYQTLYYFIGEKIGFWTPADTNYSDLYSSLFPWTIPLFIGFSASITEEGIFRLFGILFLKKYLKKTWLAILITAVSWAFLHSSYPQDPWFARGIELSIEGIIWGIVFVRYGILASMTAHYTFNSLLGAVTFYASHNLSIIVSATLVASIPLIIALITLLLAIRKKRFLQEKKEWLNASLNDLLTKTKSQTKKLTETITLPTSYLPLSKKILTLLLGTVIIGTIALWYFFPKIQLDQTPITITKQQALHIASNVLNKKTNQNVRDYHSVTTFQDTADGLAQRYILEKANFAALKEIYPHQLASSLWEIRFFKPLQKEEYSVVLFPDGKLYQINHILDEDAPGANLNENQALAIAQNYLVTEKDYNIDNFIVVNNEKEKRKKRTDHVFIFEEKNRKIAQATFRTSVSVIGDEPSDFHNFIKLPEDWIREHQKTTTLDFILQSLITVFGFGLGFIGLLTFLQMVRTKEIQFRRAFFLAGITSILFIFGIINAYPTFFSSYPTSIPLYNFIWQKILNNTYSTLFLFVQQTIIISLGFALWKKYVGSLSFPSFFYQRDALIVGYATPLIGLASSTLFTYLLLTHNWLRNAPSYLEATGLTHFFPVISILANLPDSLITTALMGIVILLVKKLFKKWIIVFIVILCIAIIGVLPNNHTPQDIFLNVVSTLLKLIGICIFIGLIARNNFLAYIYVAVINILLAGGIALLQAGHPFYTINGIVLLILSLFPIFFFFISLMKNKK